MPHNPFYKGDGGNHHQYSVTTWLESLVQRHTGLDFLQIEQLDYIDWLFLRREAFISALNRTEAGSEYLDKAWLLEQTEPDREKLRERFGGQKGMSDE